MPIYEYRCIACGHVFERIRPMGDTGGGLECPECGAEGPEKLLSVFAAGNAGAPSGGVGGCGGGGFT